MLTPLPPVPPPPTRPPDKISILTSALGTMRLLRFELQHERRMSEQYARSRLPPSGQYYWQQQTSSIMSQGHTTFSPSLRISAELELAARAKAAAMAAARGLGPGFVVGSGYGSTYNKGFKKLRLHPDPWQHGPPPPPAPAQIKERDSHHNGITTHIPPSPGDSSRAQSPLVTALRASG